MKKTAVHDMNISHLKDGRKAGEQHQPEAGSVRHIYEWLNNNGEMLNETELADGGDATRARLHDVTELKPTLKSLGIEKHHTKIINEIYYLKPLRLNEIYFR